MIREPAGCAPDDQPETFDREWVGLVTHGGARLGGPVNDEAAEEPLPANEGRLVLLLSDDPLLTRALTRLLRNAGYEVVSAETSHVSLPSSDSRRPALTIVDVSDDRRRRELDVSSHPVDLPAATRVLWIGDVSEGDERREGHLPKPFTGSQLLSEVAALLGH